MIFSRDHPDVVELATAWGLDRRMAIAVLELYVRLPRFRIVPVTGGWRDPALQDKLWAQGRSAPGPIVTYARAWESPHNWGMAVDLEYSSADRDRLVLEAKRLGLEWGGDWPGAKRDPPHFQLRNWRDLRKWGSPLG